MEFTWRRPSERTEVRFCSDLDEVLGAAMDGHVFAVVDGNVARLWDVGPGRLGVTGKNVFLLDVREEHKSPSTLGRIWNAMADAGMVRDSVILGVGGGITLDVAALAASTWHRGTRLVLVPTTVLAMADACLGGKTAVNVAGAKNQVGTFYPADTVLITESFVNTLSPREYRNGMAEILKAGLIGDREIGRLLLDAPSRDGDHGWLRELVRRSLDVKGGVVSTDLVESGHRRLLNLGHTLGHALESVSGFSLTHGEAVGIGIVAASVMAGADDLTGEVRTILETVGLPRGLGGTGAGIGEIMSFLERDKKTSGGVRTWILPYGWEDCRQSSLDPGVERELLGKALDALGDD